MEFRNTTSSGFPLSYKFQDFLPGYFSAIRALKNINPIDYQESLSPRALLQQMKQNRSKGKFSDGRSGSFMWFSPDNKYIIKTITEEEADVIKEIIQGYYDVSIGLII
jgi:1-phosphatidylinositol-4-phosphate 5-kinase